MTAHTQVKHTDCDRQHCPICEGGLSCCEVCNGAEASMPTDCPGVRMSRDQENEVQFGSLDYLESVGWVRQSAQ
jgi:hypothetical protein